ncbi:MAG: redoxin domain-containing protein [Rickettsiales bacterium]
MKIMPTQKVPPLQIETVGRGVWTLKESNPEHFTLVIFYRGSHCVICRRYLTELNKKCAEFEKNGVNLIAISADTKARAERAVKEWGLDALTVGFSFDLHKAEDWGLFVSSRVERETVQEPEHFLEPGTFLINPDETLYASSVQNMPFARPSVSELLEGVKFVTKERYPARGNALVA